MVSLFDQIKILLGIGVNAEEETGPLVNQQAEFQDIPLADLADNSIHYDVLPFLRKSDASELQKQDGEVGVQGPQLKHAGELERLKYYAELAKQNKLDSNELNEDAE
jgi:hypothetical protein